MTSKIEAPATPSVLQWARETLGFNLMEAAQKARVKHNLLASWESGEQKPTIAQLRRLSETYKRPLATFFLPAAPQDSRPPKDFRRLSETEPRPLSTCLRLEIRRCELRQSFVAESTNKPPAKLRKILSAATLNDSAEQVAQRIRAVLSVSMSQQKRWRAPNIAMRNWIDTVESAGFLVFQASRVDIAEMRGVSFYDTSAPAILLNSADSPHGRIFTLMHELCHLVLGNVGLCDYSEPEELSSPEKRTEVFCNQFAASLLVPIDVFTAHPSVNIAQHSFDWSDQELKSLSRDFSVSTEVILRRLLTIGRTSPSFYQAKRSDFLEGARQYRKSLQSDKGGPPWHRRVIASNGRRFTRMVLNAYDEEAITGSDVSEYLGTKLTHLPAIEHEVLA